ncbi:MAG: bifunctional histidinol-phosphatase/imidazoleglycerol-phosphate dehydratase HisB [Candidatus Azobacteroides sp.]|nr:bifunctional histidinol-phosphatase/imidazoleglycerol-phosphate dehydratase HisB [Candidatus Azobacteroides sp.]
MKKKALFIDRDGTLIVEPPVTFQVDTLDDLEFLPGVIRNLYWIRKHLDFEWVMASNQDGLGTSAYPQENFDRVQEKILTIFRNEDIIFDEILIDKSFPEENLPSRKPGIALFRPYLTGNYDLENSFVIGDRLTDVQLAANLGCKAILLSAEKSFLDDYPELKSSCVLIAPHWDAISPFLFSKERKVRIERITKETQVEIEILLDGNGKTDISTGLHFFDHLLEQIGKHSGMDLRIQVAGDLQVDEHHTIEDTGIALGEALQRALGNKRGIERYGFCLPMDDCLCSVALDFGGRAWLVWDAEFRREKIGDVPTEMFLHFFKSLSDSAKMNLNIRAEGQNEHHKIEGIFKAFARSVRMAVRRDIFSGELPSTKGVL